MEKGRSFSRGIIEKSKLQEVHEGCNLFLFFTFVIVKGKNSEF